MLATEDASVITKQDSTLIEKVLVCAEQDINEKDILRYIITINPKLNSEVNNSKNKEQIQNFFKTFYTTWLARCTAELFGLTLDSCCVPAHQYDTVRMINEFIAKEHFPKMGKQSLNEDFLIKLRKKIDCVQTEGIKPFVESEMPQENFLFQGVKRIFENQANFQSALIKIEGDSNRIFSLQDLKISVNFKHALEIIRAPLNQFLKDYKVPTPPADTSATPPIFIHTFNTKTEIADEYATLSLTETVQKYIGKRKAENKTYHFWGRLFAFTGKPFSVEDKENAINKIIYWKERETGNKSDDSQDIQNQFSPRDIAAIRDHRLGKLCAKHNEELERLFKFAQSKKPALEQQADTAPLLPPRPATNP